MNCYNSETWLREAIESVLAQTYPAWELVFWDNASTDASQAIARSYGERIRYFRGSETVPLGAARNLALSQARGQYLALLDCDDIWLPELLEEQVSVMESGDYALCYGGIIVIDASGREFKRMVPPRRSGNLFDALLRQFDIYPPATMLRRSTLERRRLGFDPLMTASEEYCLFMQLAAVEPVFSIPKPLAKYRVHERALTNASLGRWAHEREYTLRLIEEANPGIRERYRLGFAKARARIRYYRARFHVARRERGAAIRALAPTILLDLRYLALFGLLFLPLRVWERVHEARSGRRQYGVE
jgi:glycosyltransferase involved in cell wall biosynthesis